MLEDREANSFGREAGNVGANQFINLVRVLVWNQPAGYFCLGVGRNNGLAAFANEPGIDPVDIKGRPGACPF